MKVEGTWDGIDESGAIGRTVEPLSKGDVIVPLYDSFDAASSEPSYTYEGDEYRVGGKGLKVRYDYLPAGAYRYQFMIEDVFGDTMITDEVGLEVDEDGKTYLSE